MERQKKYIVVSALLWKFLERLGIQAIQFVIQIFLARLLSPDNYGILAIIIVFINIASVFVQMGFGTALVQKEKVDDVDYSSSFWVSFSISIIVYCILFLSAPSIGKFYRNDELSLYLRVLGVIVFPGAYNSIQNAIIQRKLLFKELFSVSIKTVILSGSIGIFLAFNRFGIWSLIAQQISYNIIICILLSQKVHWKPKLQFSVESVRQQFRFGSKLLASSLVNTLYRNFRSLVVGRKFPSETLGYLNRAEQLPSILVNNINGSMQTVLFPIYSAEQNNIKALRALMRKAIRMSSFILFPMMMGLATVAEELIVILLTEKWLPCVGLMRILCFEFVFYPLHTTNLQAFNSLGRSDIFFKLEVIKEALEVAVLLFSVRYGIYGIAISSVIMSLVCTGINAYPSKKLFEYSYGQQVRDILPAFLLSCFMAVLVGCISFLRFNIVLSLIIKILSGVLIYSFLAYLFHFDELETLKNIVISLMKKRK